MKGKDLVRGSVQEKEEKTAKATTRDLKSFQPPRMESHYL